ncbi:Protein pid-4 [Caenorhabditis elegans]|uniref:Protein pid-4 n=1 Tax=Caenorhabditis elegans TaxID=6239 RepID=PID4_CAEEL|nr:Protein pid-4 [Caenorhabditis elegans]O44749.1 RecName: Full=Protein pid-4; AltName: Full=piRNA-induced silencing defective protein 4 [Caenorhabditis elegans]CCD70126.1 Protein pid-4 [Caenorhabditis elegans]|eukprot:NP_491488.1 Uncharacterized protein CELE_W03G9.2 [Caenorhabditis elegans]
MNTHNARDSDDESPLESEEHLKRFFAGRNLYSQTKIDDARKKSHDAKYAKEVEWDAKDTAKGKPVFKKYRQEIADKTSRCDAQFINNLHTYYGNGSELRELPETHYAVDFMGTTIATTEMTAELKKLKVLKKKTATSQFVREHRQLGFIPTPSRRSLSCTGRFMNFETKCDERPDRTNPEFSVGNNNFLSATISNLDEDFKTPSNCEHVASIVPKEISNALTALIPHVNVFDYEKGEMEIGKVLCSNKNLHAYVIPKQHDQEQMLKDFSARFLAWYNKLSHLQRDTFGTDKDPKRSGKQEDGKPMKPYFWRVNVILCLQEFQEEGTMFRRARHVCGIRPHKSQPGLDLYIEIDTGSMRALKTNYLTVRKLPQEFANVPTPILEVRFEGAKTEEDVARRIAHIRKTGRAYIKSFDTGKRKIYQNSFFNGQPKDWSNIETAVLLPPKESSMSKLFCEDRDCMGLCCTDQWLENAESSPGISTIPASWIADKNKKPFVDRSPQKFKFPASGSYMKPAN